MMQYQLAIFDMDGTILNTLDDLANSLNHALRQCELPIRSKQEVCSFVGNGIRKLIERGVPYGTDLPLIDQVHQAFTAHYQVHCADNTKPYPEIPELIQTLRQAGLKTAVVSNKADYAVQELCTQYFKGMFDIAVGERKGIQKKPAPDAVFEVLKKLNIKVQHAVYIGDSDVDIATAQNAGMSSILVDWGFRTRDFLMQHHAKTIVSHPQQIADFLL